MSKWVVVIKAGALSVAWGLLNAITAEFFTTYGRGTPLGCAVLDVTSVLLLDIAGIMDLFKNKILNSEYKNKISFLI